jgi:hypothetical protein
MTEQENRLYAVNLMNRADVAFDARDVAVVGKIIEVLEADVADLLNRYAAEVDSFHSVAPGFVRNAAELIVEGRHRPELPPVKPADAHGLRVIASDVEALFHRDPELNPEGPAK